MEDGADDRSGEQADETELEGLSGQDGQRLLRRLVD